MRERVPSGPTAFNELLAPMLTAKDEEERRLHSLQIHDAEHGILINFAKHVVNGLRVAMEQEVVLKAVATAHNHLMVKEMMAAPGAGETSGPVGCSLTQTRIHQNANLLKMEGLAKALHEVSVLITVFCST